MSPQNKAILKWFKDNPGKYLTTLIAMRELGICRLSERIREIERIAKPHCRIGWGDVEVKYPIKHVWQTVKTRYGKSRVMGYRL